MLHPYYYAESINPTSSHLLSVEQVVRSDVQRMETDKNILILVLLSSNITKTLDEMSTENKSQVFPTRKQKRW